MNPRATVALLLLTLLAAGAVFYVRRSFEPTRQAEENRRFAAVFEPDDVREIDIKRGNDTVSLRRESGGWRLTAPVEDRASPEAVDRLLMASRFMEVRDRQTGRSPDQFPEAALAPPRIRLELRGEETIGLNLGAGTALPQEVFASVDGERGVLRVADTVVGLADVPADSFRDPRLTELVADDIEKFTVRRADGEMTLRRERGKWMIDKPVRAPADWQAVRAFLEPLLGLRIAAFGARATDTAAMLPGQEATVSFTPRGGGEDLELRITVSETDAKEFTAFFKPRGGDLVVDGAAASIFRVSPDELRNRSLGRVDIDTVDRIRLESDGAAVTLRREGDGWVGDPDVKRRSEADIAGLVAAFNAAEVAEFRTTESAEETGLAAPPQRIEFIAWLSENTAEEAAGGHIVAGAELGRNAPDGGNYARAAGSDETVTIPAALSEAVRVCVFPPDAVNSPR